MTGELQFPWIRDG